jgi:1-acyl-sn-glycerol-3-phosphate acyltransferase
VLYAILKPLAVLFMRLYFRVEARGQEHVPRTGALLLVANHASVLDPPLVGGMTPRPVSFMAKAELFRIPLFGALIRRLNARPVRREGADPSALRLALRLLEEQRALLVFPEGTRGDEQTLRPAKAGAGMLAVLSGATVVPVYIRGSGSTWPRGRRLPRPGKVVVSFGPPLKFPGGTGPGRKESYDAASRDMMAAIARLKDAAGSPEPGPASPREGRRAVGEVGAGGASTSLKYTYGRQYGEG